MHFHFDFEAWDGTKEQRIKLNFTVPREYNLYRIIKITDNNFTRFYYLLLFLYQNQKNVKKKLNKNNFYPPGKTTKTKMEIQLKQFFF